MKITYISHASLLIEVNGVKILTDPWMAGSAYCGQWYIFPPPVADYQSLLKDIDFVLISHGHEDHSHRETLKLINTSAHVFFPYSWYDGAVDYFQDLGFNKVTEAINEKIYPLKGGCEVQFYANNLDNILVLKANGQVLIDVNDALPSTSPAIIDYFIAKLTANFPKIDYLFSSYGGASYYPNTIKCDWKDDVEVGRIRELFFLDNFCKIASGIKANYSIPFASDFVLLDDHQLWINKVKFSRNKIAEYFHRHYPQETDSTQIVEMYPGDGFVNGEIRLRSDYHEKFKSTEIDELVAEVYHRDMLAKRNEQTLSKEAFLALYEKVQNHIKTSFHTVPPSTRKHLLFSIQITDYKANQRICVDLSQKVPRVELIDRQAEEQQLLLKVKSAILDYSISHEWGGDAIIIGYGCEIEIANKEAIALQLDIFAVQLLTRYPNTKAYIKKNPIRAFHYLMKDKIKRRLFLEKVIKRRENKTYTDPLLGDVAIWFNRSTCEICRKCNLPVLTDELAAKYYTVNDRAVGSNG